MPYAVSCRAAVCFYDFVAAWQVSVGWETMLMSLGLQHSKGNKAAEDEASKGAEQEIKKIQESGKKGQAGVVKNLLSAVYDAKPVAPSAAA